MKITTRHPRSRHGIPVILSDKSQVMNYPRGITAALKICNLKPGEIAEMAGITRASVTHYTSGRQTPSAAFLNVLADALEDASQAPDQ